MAETTQEQLEILENAIKGLEQAIPLIITPSRNQEGLQLVVQAADHIAELPIDTNLKKLATAMKILTNGESEILTTVSYQAFILDILEMLTVLLNKLEHDGNIAEIEIEKHVHVAEYLIRVAERIINRYKLNVIFEPEYEAKSLRAFMVLKELSEVVRFLNISPDISENQNANLDKGLEIDCLSQESPEELHKIAGSVLEVQNVQIFTETRPQSVKMLDPPDHPNSFDRKINSYLEG